RDDSGRLVGVASIYEEALPEQPAVPLAWRVRGVAVATEWRRAGIGRSLMQACEAHAARRGGALVWCNARTTAVAFYERLGYRALGGVFDVPGVGPHVRMQRPL
ncbi:MAG: GNAT family N-acetyltransferase, partial [Candidatus Binatia bacterium]